MKITLKITSIEISEYDSYTMDGVDMSGADGDLDQEIEDYLASWTAHLTTCLRSEFPGAWVLVTRLGGRQRSKVEVYSGDTDIGDRRYSYGYTYDERVRVAIQDAWTCHHY